MRKMMLKPYISGSEKIMSFRMQCAMCECEIVLTIATKNFPFLIMNSQILDQFMREETDLFFVGPYPCCQRCSDLIRQGIKEGTLV